MTALGDRAGRRGARIHRWSAAAVVVVLATAAWCGPAAAQTPVSFVARIDGRPISQATERHPLRLNPARSLILELVVTNRSAQPVQIRTLRLSGTVIGLTFFGFETTVGINVAPGTTVTRRFSLDLAGLGGQATGLIPGSLSVLDSRRHRLASQSFVVDVRGSLLSVYGVFGLALVVATGLSIGGALTAMYRSQLSPNRWRRGLRFLPGGIGLGLSVVFTLSALRVFVAQPGRWVPIVLLTAVALFALGFLTPVQEDEWEPVPQGRLADTNWSEPVRRR